MTPDTKQEFRIQLKDMHTGESIITSGGNAIICQNGDAAKETLYDSDGSSLSNPISLTRGFANFFAGVDVGSVDMYIVAPGGQFVVAKGIVPGGPNEILVDTFAINQCMVIPFSMTDMTANTEYDFGVDEPDDAIFLPHPFVDVTTADATETIDVGTDSNDSGDADGFIDGLSVASQAKVLATIGFTVGTNNTVVDITGGDQEWTKGVFFHPAATKVAKSEGGDAAATDGNGFAYSEPHVSTGKSITGTLSAGSDTAEGFIYLPYLLAA